MITPEEAKQHRQHSVNCWINRLDEQLQSEMEQREGPYVLRTGDAKPQEVAEQLARRVREMGWHARVHYEKGGDGRIVRGWYITVQEEEFKAVEPRTGRKRAERVWPEIKGWWPWWSRGG